MFAAMANVKTTVPELIKSATQIFRAKGYHQTSMADLAAAAGLTKGAFYHHFRDKESVMRAALGQFAAVAKTRCFDICHDRSLPLDKRVHHLTNSTRRLFGSVTDGCFVANTALETSGTGAPFAGELRAFMNDWTAAIATLAEDAGRDDPKEFGRRAIADLEGSIVLMQIYGDRQHFEAALVRLRENLLRR